MPLECPNPNCSPRPSTFKAYPDWKQRELVDKPGVMPVRLVCSHCGHRVKAWVINKEVRKIVDRIDRIEESIDSISDNLDAIIKQTKKPWWRFW